MSEPRPALRTPPQSELGQVAIDFTPEEIKAAMAFRERTREKARDRKRNWKIRQQQKQTAGG